MDHTQAQNWINNYVAVWRGSSTIHLDDIFAPHVTYKVSPWKEAIHGIAKLTTFWESSRSAREEFSLESTIIAVEGRTAIAKILVDYKDDSVRWQDLWIFTLDGEGRCISFEEWPFAEGQYDGQS